MFAGLFGEVAAPKMASDLSTIFDEIGPDLVVHEVAELGVTPIATSRGVPRVVVAFSGALPKAVLAAAAEAVGGVWDSFSLSVPADLGLYEHDYLHPFPGPLGQRPAPAAVRDVRPVAAEGIDTIDVGWLGRLGVDRPAVYVTYGTEMGQLAPWRMLLWALARLDVDAVVTTGNSVDLAPLLGELDEASRSRIHVHDYVPQAGVLARASVVMSHGGAGTMLAAGAAAVPQIVVPIAADQFDNADAFAAAGAAVAVDGSSLTSDALAAELVGMLTDEGVRRAAKYLAEQFAAMPHPDEALAKITD
jgi:UDP:flavonoid glycosyltransferase YjiC (YdhE family)